ncbi:D-TA family PLP-dependent enzyme [Tautonia marina]|uniref:D-TA family PLP-dependent enzyme n=1 Tax=Tautonia marina TaxID=2653855 RepID=UPI00191C3223|nr:D-TA family PLP-dependent enzyme [Tautonia marina]
MPMLAPEQAAERYHIDDLSQIPSPSLVIFVDIVRENLRKMLELVGDPARLRPHVKTHKMPAIVRMALEEGITKHKCATIAEAEMLGQAGAPDVLLAYQPVGPNVERMIRLLTTYPNTTFRTVVDEPGPAQALSDAVSRVGRSLPTLIDLNVGMNRTGIIPGPEADALYAEIARLPGLEPDGLHAYDGHSSDPDLDQRRSLVMSIVKEVTAMRDRLESQGLPVPRIVMGGTPPFPIYAGLDLPNLECSPGTIVLHDVGYGAKFPDLPFTPAALLLGRVASRPKPGLLCLDIGTKAVASDPIGDRVAVLGIPDAKLGRQNEEHLMVETPAAADFPPGTPVLAIPVHICPTCALHREAFAIQDGKVIDRWPVIARDRTLTI